MDCTEDVFWSEWSGCKATDTGALFDVDVATYGTDDWERNTVKCGNAGLQYRKRISGQGVSCSDKQERVCHGTTDATYIQCSSTTSSGICDCVPRANSSNEAKQDCVTSSWYPMGKEKFSTIITYHGEIKPLRCSKECDAGDGDGGGKSEFRRLVLASAVGGTCKQSLKEMRDCNTHLCRQDCRNGTWQNVGPEYQNSPGCQEAHKTLQAKVWVQNEQVRKKLANGHECMIGTDVYKPGEMKKSVIRTGAKRKCRFGNWISLESATGIIADVLRNPEMKISPSQIQPIISKVERGKFNTITSEKTVDVVNNTNEILRRPVPDGCQNVFETVALLGESDCNALIHAFDDRFTENVDNKIYIERKDIENVIGYDKVQLMCEYTYDRLNKFNAFGTKEEFILRKSISDPLVAVPFHRDWDDTIEQYVTTSVVLNNDYEGGVLLHLDNDRLTHVDQTVGYMTVHDLSTIHAVSPITSGVRYKLFFCIGPEDSTPEVMLKTQS